eukprot:463262-Prymnesium_polylepis.1
MVCSFGSRIVPARALSPTRLECYTPPGESDITFAVSMNGQDFVNSSGRFTYLPVLHVLGVAPTAGALGGGSFVTIQVGGLSNFSAALAQLQCRFNLTSTAASMVSTTAVLCVSPPANVEGAVAVEISNNNLIDFTSDGFTFSYVNVRLKSISPAQGPLTGGTTIRLVGSNLAVTQLDVVFCRFGALAVQVKATVQSKSLLLCRSPAAPVAEKQALELVSNGVVYEGAGSFQFQLVPVVQA